MKITPLDIVGKRFKRLLILKHEGGEGTLSDQLYEAQCDCGAVIRVTRKSLLKNHKGSCGCLRSESSSANRTKHGETIRFNGAHVTPEWRAWNAMIDRCSRPSHPSFHNYGGRGITVYAEWLSSFEEFLAYVGRRPSSVHSLDRINNNGNYEPGNVRWATHKEQCGNTRRSRVIECSGRSQTLTGWAEETGLSKSLILDRLKRGWSSEEALRTPVNSTRRYPRVSVLVIESIRNLHSNGVPVKEICNKTGVSVTSVRRIVNRLGAYRDA